MKKRILAFLLAVVMTVGLLPMSALATSVPTVYLSISDDAKYASGKNGEAMAYVPVKLSDLETVKLEDYDLGHFAQDADSDGQEDITVLHLYLYAHKEYYADGAEGQLTAEGSPGSLYMTQFWGHDCNLTYYVNGEYPAMDGWGITADQLVLSNGDFVDVTMYTSWNFYSDSAAGYHYFLDENTDITHGYTAQAGQAQTIALGRAFSSMGMPTEMTLEEGYTIWYGTSLYADDAKSVITDETGSAEIAFPEAGTYYLWADGGYGAEYSDDIVSSPAYAEVTVTAPACTHETWKDATCTAPKTCADCGATEGAPNPDAHNYVDGTCEYCGEADPTTLYTVTLPSSEGYTVIATEGSTSPVTTGGSYSFTVTIAEGYNGSGMVVTANDTTLTASDGIYTISNITADQTVTVEGVVEETPEPEQPAPTWQQVMAKTQAYLTAQAEAAHPIVGSTSGEWLVLGLARAGVSADEDFFQGYCENVLAEEIDASGRLDANRSTENSRVILALTALGKDVTNVGGHDLLQGLSDQDFVKKQGINGPVWALIALDSHNYEIPANADPSKQVTREWLVDYILDNQLTNGGWKIQGQSPDDMTPMAVQALAPYYNTNSQVKALNNSQVNAAVDKALTIMGEMAETTTSPETLSQIIVARSTLGLDSEAAVAKLAALAQEDGSFKKGPSDNNANQMATEQAFYGLVAYDRFQSGKTALYDMSDVEIDKVEGDTPQEPVLVTGITLNKSTLTLEVGKTAALTATVTPSNATDKTVTWTSSNASVAAVSSQGRITAKAEGAAIITAKAGGKTAVCLVTVAAQEVPLDFGLAESQIKGYVTVSFEDFGQRVAGESMSSIYTKALGTIIPAAQVPFKTGDTIASVTIRLLDAMDYTSSYQGSVTSGFYLESIGNFTHKGTYYRSFGEFDAGVGSGWMITWNNWFIDKGASEFSVKNGDVIRWQYTCQLGADIGKDVSGDLAAVEAVEKLIDAIGAVTKDSGKAIEAARTAYDKLTFDQKKLVENYSKLTTAEKTYAALLEIDHPYTDVTGHWAEEAITFVYEKGLMTGTKADKFSPNVELSRAMLVTILYRMEGEPAVTADNTFSDVKADTWYTDAVLWAAEKGIVNGVGRDRFAPDQDITREQMAAMLLRYSDYKGYDTTRKNDLTGYTDEDQISTWALEALRWANAEGLITGRKTDLLVPRGDTTRAETATILMRYLETIA
ncbi:MAG: S-layer homology domain-containing protein [Ruminiclostridium sp.]|nr:S-layer homology domain-containing protein [Ruminiclostridium sp.]